VTQFESHETTNKGNKFNSILISVKKLNFRLDEDLLEN